MQTPDQAPPRARSLARRAGQLLLVFAAVTALGTWFASPVIPTSWRLASGAAIGAIVVATTIGYRALAPRVGFWTAWAAVTVAWAVLVPALAAVTGGCTHTTAGPCTVRTLSSWIVTGAWIAGLQLMVVLAARAASWSSRWSWRTLTHLAAWIRSGGWADPESGTDPDVPGPAGRSVRRSTNVEESP